MKKNWLKIVAKNLSFMAASTIVDSGLRFIAYGIAAKNLGPTAFGLNAFMFTTFFFFSGLANFGLPTFGIREIAKNKPNHIPDTVSRIFTAQLILTIIAFLLMQLFVFITQSGRDAILLGIIYGFSLFGSNLIDWVLIGYEKMEYMAITKLVNGLGVLGLVIILVKDPTDVLMMGMIESFTFIITGIILFFITIRQVKIFFYITPVEFFETIKASFSLGISLMVIRLGASLPILFLGLTSTNYEVGIFKTMELIPNFIRVGSRLWSQTFFPTATRLFADSQNTFLKILQLIHKYMNFMIIGLVTILFIFGQNLILFVFGPEYSAQLMVFYILLIVAVLDGALDPLVRLLPAFYAQQQYWISVLTRTTLLFVFSMLFARYGAQAEGIAIVISILISFPVVFYFYRQIFAKNFLFWNFVKLICIATLSIMIALVFDDNIIRMGVSVISFLLLSMVVGILSKEEIQKVFRIISE